MFCWERVLFEEKQEKDERKEKVQQSPEVKWQKGSRLSPHGQEKIMLEE